MNRKSLRKMFNIKDKRGDQDKMEAEEAVKMGFTESLACRWAQKMNKEREGEYIDYLKMKLGFEMLLINLSKLVLVYGVAILFHLLWQTLIMHGAYFAIRKTAFGLHASSSMICSLISVAMFVGIPYLCDHYIMMNNLEAGLIGLFSTLLLYRYAPADTDKFPLLGKERREKLRKTTTKSRLLIVLTALLIPSPTIKALLLMGILLQVLMILPITYKLLKRSYNNYENYDAENV
ncbi:accessory gene regulator B family protein [Paenibacillus ihuae]|uniref:accessory gene regulator B family protein n=1 Tax=Paenibacillus ihuae TaxID=1232431 RepID=UPI001FD73A4A|nr:accessory gene regulator B family protein [Paenibacillus ihuae]